MRLRRAPRAMSPSSLLLTALLALTTRRRPPLFADAARSLSARRVRGAPPSRAADKYDRSVTTFSPEGRLLQLEYALIAAEERGRGVTVCVERDGVVVFAFPSGDDDDCAGVSDASSPTPIDGEADGTNGALDGTPRPKGEPASPPDFSAADADFDPAHNAKIHRLSPTHLLLTSGMRGDARTLAAAFRRVAASWTHVHYGEVATARELAQEMGRVRHGIGLQPGARVLGVMGMLIGLDDVDDADAPTEDVRPGVEVRMYRSLPGGTMDRCNVCCTGGGADAAGNAARKEAMEALLHAVSSNEDEDAIDKSLPEEDLILQKEEKLREIIEEVGRVALKYHPDSQSKEETTNAAARDDGKKRVAVDIWAVRASPAIPTNQNERNPAFISPHRYLGKALMETRYARRVALDQLSIAAQCLSHKTAKI